MEGHFSNRTPARKRLFRAYAKLLCIVTLFWLAIRQRPNPGFRAGGHGVIENSGLLFAQRSRFAHQLGAEFDLVVTTTDDVQKRVHVHDDGPHTTSLPESLVLLPI